MKTLDLNILPSLIRGKKYVSIEKVPHAFRKDLLMFIIGETLMKTEQGEIAVSKNLYQRWLDKLFNKGFYYDVDLRIDE